ncbi:hypothetical protein FB45DRAFT_1040821 [Roridomyces roridus]|uniref:Uncharacterized protein n=1 Tax=Roridomyces roridus TaxID=1738132 RepID=A0AAD7F9E2_9AGAR|nr:hypothetical protein FB45DRAFT_1040821 [Roridomyces roridus]
MSSTSESAPKDVWVIMQTDYDHHTDEEGRSHLASQVVFESLQEANKEARWALCETCGFEDEEELNHVERDEKNIGSSTEAYIGYAYVREDERDNVKVAVERMTFQRAVKPSKESKKKRKIQEVIEISSD